MIKFFELIKSSSYLLIISIVFLISGVCANAQTIPKNGLIAWLPFNGDLTDESASGNRVFFTDNTKGGIITNELNSFSADRFGRARSAIQLNNLSQNCAIKVRLPQKFNLLDRTIALWIKSPTQSFKRYSNIFELGNYPEVKQYCSILGDESSYISQKREGKISCLIPEGGYVESRTYLNDGNWHHLVLVVSSKENSHKIYIDGRLDSDSYLEVPINNNLNPYSLNPKKSITEITVDYFVFGNVFRNDSECAFGGIIDDVGVWSRALSDSEISVLFNQYYTQNTWPNVKTDSRIKSINSDFNAINTSSHNSSSDDISKNNSQNNSFKNISVDPNSEYFNPDTDIYMSSYFANVIESDCLPTISPSYSNNYACFARFKNSGVRNDYYFGSEIVNKVVSYFNSLGYTDLVKIGSTIKAGDASGLNSYYTYVEFKELNSYILKKLVTLLISLGNGEQQVPYVKSFFNSDKCMYGFVDMNGKIIIKPEYDNIGNFSEGLVRVEKRNSGGVSKIGFLNETGKMVIPLIYESSSSAFSEGLCWVQNKNGKSGYVDKFGKLVIPFQYDIAQDFKNGIAEVKKGDTWSKIDKKGLPSLGKNKYPNSKLSELAVGGTSIDNRLNSLFEDMYNEFNAKALMFGKSAVNQNMVNAETIKIKKTVEGWLDGPMTSSQQVEFNQIAKRAAGVSSFVMSIISSSLAGSSSSSRPAYGEQIGSSNRSSSNNSSRISSEVCSYCKPSNSKGHTIRDFDVTSRTYKNFRYINRPGYKLCQSCWGTGLQSQTGPKTCNQCNGERLLMCKNCSGSGKKN
jgi:hypothetical protein